jgi:hypothetical protein
VRQVHRRRQPQSFTGAARNTRIADTCVVFRQWHISTTAGLIASMAAIVALGVLYEWLRTFQGTVDRRIARRLLAAGKAKARGGSTSGRDTPEMEEDTTLLGGVRASFKAGCVRSYIIGAICVLIICMTAVPARQFLCMRARCGPRYTARRYSCPSSLCSSS